MTLNYPTKAPKMVVFIDGVEEKLRKILQKFMSEPFLIVKDKEY